MDQSNIVEVKLNSMTVLDFKTLEKGKVSWTFEKETKFSIINVATCLESSTIFEALEFGFGYDTEVGKAAISLEIQQNGKSMHFTHLKSIERGHFYRVKVNGENLKNVNQKEYFERLNNLNVFASTQSFLFKVGDQNTMAARNIDLRVFLEKYLLNKPDVKDDYDRKQQMLDTMMKEKNLYNEAAKLTKFMTDDLKMHKMRLDVKSKAFCGVQDLSSLKMYDHLKHIEMMQQKLENLESSSIGEGPTELIEQLVDEVVDFKKIMEKVDCSNLTEDQQMSWNDCRKDLETEIDKVQKAFKTLNILKEAPNQARSATASKISAVKYENLDLENAVDNARLKLRQAEIQKRAHDIKQEMDADMAAYHQLKQNLRSNPTKVKNVTDQPSVKNLKKTARDAKMKPNHINYNKPPYTFKIEGYQTVRQVRDILNTIPNKAGVYKVFSDDEKTYNNINSVAGNKQWFGKYGRQIQSICTARLDKNKPEMWKSIGYESDSSSSDDDNNGNAPANNTQAATAQTLEPMQTNQDIDAKICEATNELKDAEKRLAAKYLKDFGGILPALGFDRFDKNDTGAIIDVVKLCMRYEHVFNSNEPFPQAMIDEIQAQHDRLQEIKVRTQRMADIDSKIAIPLKELLNAERNRIASYVQTYAKAEYGYLFDMIEPAQPGAAQACLDAIAPENRPNIDPNEQSVTKVRKAVNAKIKGIEQKAIMLQNSDLCIHVDGTDLTKQFQKKARSTKLEMVKESKKFKERSAEFEQRFDLFRQIFVEYANYCATIWRFSVSLDGESESSLLDRPIRMTVYDRSRGPEYEQGTTLNHHAAAFVLQLAINKAIGSPIIIIDCMDYIAERPLISAMIKLLKKVAAEGVQVILLEIKPQEKERIIDTHHNMWIENDVEKIYDTTKRVNVPGDQRSQLDTPQSLFHLTTSSDGTSLNDRDNLSVAQHTDIPSGLSQGRVLASSTPKT